MPERAAASATLALYEVMAGIAVEMRAAARAENWDLLIELDAVRATHVAQLQRMPASTEMTPQQRERGSALLRQMLADDAETRTLAAAGMTQLTILMNSANTERKLSKAYTDGL